ncbi:MAG: hypothetical protein WD004_05305 [Actinomycetota bacterium]
MPAAVPDVATATVAVAEIRAEFRELPHGRLSATAERAMLDRCVQATLQVLFEQGAELRVAGTERHPVVEARLTGHGSAALAASTALAAADRIRHIGGGRFVLAGAVGEGYEADGEGGTRLILGDPAGTASVLSERAAPGQVLLGGARWPELEGIESLPTRSASPGAAHVPVFVLRGVR